VTQEDAARPLGCLLGIAVGIAVAIQLGHVASDGAAEIGAIMAGMLILCVGAFWAYRGKRWFWALNAAWILVHLLILAEIITLKLDMSGALFKFGCLLEFFAYGGLMWLATRIWGDLDPDQPE
jgi:hypothetical protein